MNGGIGVDTIKILGPSDSGGDAGLEVKLLKFL